MKRGGGFEKAPCHSNCCLILALSPPPPFTPSRLSSQGWYAECNSRVEDATRPEKEEYLRSHLLKKPPPSFCSLPASASAHSTPLFPSSQGWYAECNSRAEDAIRREKEEYLRAKAAEELASAGDMLILEMEAKFSEMRMKLAA